jgi:hypothetical protein
MDSSSTTTTITLQKLSITLLSSPIYETISFSFIDDILTLSTVDIDLSKLT